MKNVLNLIFMHNNLNYGIVLESNFIIIVIIVLYCTNPLEKKNDIFIICYICDLCLTIIGKLG